MRKMFSEKQIQKLANQEITNTPSGEVSDVVGINASGELVKESDLGIKPIYIHPINMSKVIGSTSKFNISLLIFNNDPTPFTFATFKTWLENLVGLVSAVRCPATGSIVVGGEIYPANFLFANSTVKQIIAEPIIEDKQTSIALTLSSWGSYQVDYFQDGVNRIN